MINFSKLKMGFVAFIVVFAAFQLVAQNTIENSGNMQMHTGAQMAFFGNLTNNGTFDNNLGAAFFSGSALQTIAGANKIKFDNITVNNLSNIKLDQEMQISGTLLFSSGKIISDRSDIATEYVNFLDGATSSGSNSSKFIDGVARKTGNDAFIFPLGNGAKWARLGISAPLLISDAFTATYYNSAYTNITAMATSPTPVLNNVSDSQYWICDRSNGASNVTVQLYWEDSSQNDINNYTSDLVVARWNGSAWVNEGQSSITASSPGDVTSGVVTSFSPFTFGSLSSTLNPLPVELTNFQAIVINGDQVELNWQTSLEINSDYFEVERSNSEVVWHEIAEINGAGNSSSILNYSTIDEDPYHGYSYYRLKQIDFDGQFYYSSIRRVEIDGKEHKSVKIYPNPAQNYIIVESSLSEIEGLEIYNMQGIEVSFHTEIVVDKEKGTVINVTNLPSGVYTIKTKTTKNKVFKH